MPRRARAHSLDTGESHVFETVGEAVSTEMPTPGRYSGVWRSASDAVYVCHQGGVILSRSNPHPGLIFAVGSGGSISRWDNGRWAAMTSPVTGDLGSIVVVDETEIYACGTGNGYILEGSIDGWTRRGPFDFPLHRVAKHSGHLWVGTGLSGLQRLNPGEATLEHFKPMVQAFHFDARGDLLVSGRDCIVATQDGVDFVGQPIDAYVDLASDNTPTWIR